MDASISLYELLDVCPLTGAKNDDADAASAPVRVESCASVLVDGGRCVVAVMACTNNKLQFVVLWSDGRYSVNELPWLLDPAKQVACMTLSATPHWLFVAGASGRVIVVVPVRMVLGAAFDSIAPTPDSSAINTDMLVRRLFRDEAINEFALSGLSTSDGLATPTSLCWYESKTNGEKFYLLFGNKRGDVLIVDVQCRRVSVAIQAPESIARIDWLTDARLTSTFMLVRGFASDWLMPLERQGLTIRETLADLVLPADLSEVQHGCTVVPHVGEGSIGRIDSLRGVFQLFHTVDMMNVVLELPIGAARLVAFGERVTFVAGGEIGVLVNELAGDVERERRETFRQRIRLNEANEVMELVAIRSNRTPEWPDDLPSALVVANGGAFALRPLPDAVEVALRKLLVTDVADFNVGGATLLCSALGVDLAARCRGLVAKLVESEPPERVLRLAETASMSCVEIIDLFTAAGHTIAVLPYLVRRLLARDASVGADAQKRELSMRVFELILEQLRLDAQDRVAGSCLRRFVLHSVWYNAEEVLSALLAVPQSTDVLAAVTLMAKAHAIHDSVLDELVEKVADSLLFSSLDVLEFVACEQSRRKLIAMPTVMMKLLLKMAEYCNTMESGVSATFLFYAVRILNPFDGGEMEKFIESAREEKRISTTFVLQKLVDVFARVTALALRHPTASAQLDAMGQPSVLGKDQSKIAFVPLACAARYTVCLVERDDDGDNSIDVVLFGQPPRGDAVETTTLDLRLVLPPCAQRVVRQLACGAEHSLALTNEGRVFAFGANSYGQLGVGDRRTRGELTRVPIDGVVRVACGLYHSFAIVDGDVLAWGWSVHGQLGIRRVSKDVLTPMRVEFFGRRGKSDCVDVAAGHCHSIFLTLGGRVFTSGNCMFGQLGIGELKKSSTPKRVRFGDPSLRAVKIASGHFHCLTLLVNGVKKSAPLLMIWGASPQALKMKLLLQKRQMKSEQQLLQQAGATTESKSLSNGNSSELGTLFAGTLITAADRSHLLPCGVDVSDVVWPKDVADVELACGLQHSAVLTRQNGALYMWGKSMDFQLGFGDKHERMRPTAMHEVLQGRQVRFVALGAEQTICVDGDTGLLYAWGRNDSAQLGIETGANGAADGKPPPKPRLAGRVLTIQKGPNRVARTIRLLDNDATHFVQRPRRLVGLKCAVDECADTCQLNLEQDVLRNSLRRTLDELPFYDAVQMQTFCVKQRCDEALALLALHAGNIREAFSYDLAAAGGDEERQGLARLLRLYTRELTVVNASVALVSAIVDEVFRAFSLAVVEECFTSADVRVWLPALVLVLLGGETSERRSQMSANFVRFLVERVRAALVERATTALRRCSHVRVASPMCNGVASETNHDSWGREDFRAIDDEEDNGNVVMLDADMSVLELFNALMTPQRQVLTETDICGNTSSSSESDLDEVIASGSAAGLKRAPAEVTMSVSSFSLAFGVCRPCAVEIVVEALRAADDS